MKIFIWTKKLCIFASLVHVVSVPVMRSRCWGFLRASKVNPVSARSLYGRNMGFHEFCLDLLVFTVSRLLRAPNFLLIEANNFYF
jgi:hypothetical protein